MFASGCGMLQQAHPLTRPFRVFSNDIRFPELGRRFHNCNNDFGTRTPLCHLRIRNATDRTLAHAIAHH